MHRPRIHLRNWKADVLSGVIVALVSIPSSMGYAQIAGLPPVYGLYGSVLPILVYGLLSTSPRFVVGVDAMPAVMVGNALTGMRSGWRPQNAGSGLVSVFRTRRRRAIQAARRTERGKSREGNPES